MLAALGFLPLFAQSGIAPGPEALLAGVRQKVRQNLGRLPDYTCRLTIERSTGLEHARRLQPVDTVHLEVGYLDGKELYAWPGQKFESQKLEDMLPAGGTVATGDFALHIKAIFLSNAATFTYQGRSMHDGHETVEFQYRIVRAKSLYMVRSGPNREAVVGYHGSFRADARTLLLESLEITVDDLPHRIHLRRAGSILTYALTRIGDAEFLLPRTSELFLVGDTGRENRNLTRFENCRQYSGESVVSFAEPAAIAAQAPPPVTEVRLPAGMLVEMSLRTAIDRKLAIGDPISAVVSHDASRSGIVVIPKGAAVTGRITQMGQVSRGRVVYQVVGLKLSTVEFGAHRAQFPCSLESVSVAAAQTEVGRGKQPSDAILFVKGSSLRIPAGAHMLWRTLPVTE